MINSVNVKATVKTLAGGNNPGRTPAEVAESFKLILDDKQEKHMSARQYLAGLTSEQLHIIQTAQRMASRINADKLSEEGAENLFVPLGDNRKYVDLNNDGITEIGEAKVFVFPPPNAPESVKAAWDETAKGMTFREYALALSPFMAAQIEANAHRKADGTYEIVSPGEPGYVNIFGDEEDYCSLLNQIIERLNKLSKGLSGEQRKQYEYQMEVIRRFKENILSMHEG